MASIGVSMTATRAHVTHHSPQPVACGATDGFLIYRGDVDTVRSSLGLTGPGGRFFGSTRGDDEHCRKVCRQVPGCNAISRASGSMQCQLHGDCLSLQTADRQRLPTRCDRPTAVMTTAAQSCRGAPVWRALAGKLKDEGVGLDNIEAPSVDDCKTACERTPGCNYFVVWSQGSQRGPVLARCELRSRCVRPGTPEALGKAGQELSPMARRLKLSAYYMYPCTAEGVFFPSPGVRRTLPPGQLTGLLSMDCLAKQPGTVSTAARPSPAYVFPRGFKEYAREVGLARGRPGSLCAPKCGVGCRPVVTDLVWPDYYLVSPRPQIVRPTLRAHRVRQRAWQSLDGNCLLVPDANCTARRGAGQCRRQMLSMRSPERSSAPRCVRPLLRGDAARRRARAEWTVFDQVALDVAARSFNGREIVLLTSNRNGLSLAVNLIANLAQLGHHHALVLANGAATCNALSSHSAPPCIWSSLLQEYPTGLRAYISNP